VKGLIGMIFLGICIVIASAILVGAISFPEAMNIIFGLMFGFIFWVVVIIAIILLFILGIIIWVSINAR
jgi:hypothetical protein